MTAKTQSLAFLVLLSALLGGCECLINPGGSQPTIEAQPQSLDFGTTTPNAPVERTIALSNRGQAELLLSSVSVAGEAASQFSVTQPESLVVPAGGSLQLTVSYHPSAEGNHAAELKIQSNAANLAELAVPLSGRAVGGGDPCGNVSCNNPPDTCHEQQGTCSGGSCSYPIKDAGSSCDDGDDCTFGDSCHAGKCAGSLKVCDTPPAGTCASASSFTGYDSPGTCSGGTCQYVSHTVACSGGCTNDVCQGDPCAGISCNTPPASSCLDTTTKLSYSAQGTCNQGSCDYSPIHVPCATSEVCQTGACKWDDANLLSLSISPGSLVFSASQTVYAVAVPAGTTSVSLTPAVAQPAKATIHVDGSPATSGAAVSVALGASPTSSAVKVDAESGSTKTYTVVVTVSSGFPSQQAYVKASNTDASDIFGTSVALSADGTTLAVGAPYEGSAATGIDGNQADNSAPISGAVYLFVRAGAGWAQQAYIKASNAESSDEFGTSVALSADGNTLAVGAWAEASNATAINGNQADNSASGNGAVYVFTRSGTAWSQQAYVKAFNAFSRDGFGISVALSADGNTLAAGAWKENGSATGINGSPNTGAAQSGAAYVFVRSGTSWAQQAYVKASNTQSSDKFGVSVALSANGDTLAVGASDRNSISSGINGSGAAYVFARSGTSWAEQAYLLASNSERPDNFGRHVALSGDGNTLAVGAPEECSNATGINGDQSNNSQTGSGAVYVFTRSGTNWAQQAYVKASNTGFLDRFGASLALSGDGSTLAVGASGESSNATGINGNQADNSASTAGAAYLFTRSGTSWAQQAYVKASNTEANDGFGIGLALSGDGNTLAVGADYEDGNAIGIGGNQANNSASNSGAVYVFAR